MCSRATVCVITENHSVKMKYLKLSTPGQEHRMPLVGLGTWRAPPEEAEAAVEAALNAGYRHIGKEKLSCEKMYFA